MIVAQIISQSGPFVPTGLGLGSVIAALCSWERNRSVAWAIVAALLSWLYVAYFLFTRGKQQPTADQPIPRFPLGVRRDRVLHPASKDRENFRT